MTPVRIVCLLWIIAASTGIAQENSPPAPPPAPEEAKSIARLQVLIPALEDAKTELDDRRARLAAAETDEEKTEAAKEVAEQRERVAQLRANFLTIATGVEEANYLGLGSEAASWEQNLEDIIAPLSREVRELTSGARELEELQNDLREWEERKRLAEDAKRSLDDLLTSVQSPEIRKELGDALDRWKDRIAESASQIEVIREKLEQRQRESPSTWETVSESFAEFWRSRGLNVLLAVALAVFVFIAARRSYRLVRRVSPIHRKGGHNLAARILDLAWAGIAALLALAAAVVVLYLRGDWLLLTLAILAFLGILWASKQALPPYLEQIRLILNLGPVRQGERMIFEGVPWRVDRLNFYCEFSNPQLAGAVLRLPVRDVIPLHSRPAPPKEQWFPTHADDWVRLSDGTFGKVIQQSQEQVVVLRLGGSLKTYPTPDFLAATPENLSRGFRINTSFGIDYQHQQICTTEVPAIFQAAVEQALVERVERDNLRSLKVEFASAGASSLDYAVLADFSGEVGSRYNVLERLIHKTCVDVCNARGWVIPFTQITVHQA